MSAFLFLAELSHMSQLMLRKLYICVIYYTISAIIVYFNFKIRIKIVKHFFKSNLYLGRI